VPAAAQKQRSSLILLTNHYPFGTGEAFLENEIPHLLKEFDQVTIVTKNTTDSLRSGQPGLKIFRISARGNWREFMITILFLCRHCFMATKVLTSEIRNLRLHKKKISRYIVSKMIHDLFKAATRAYHLKKVINQISANSNLTLYSYWLDSSALAMLFITHDNKISRVSRAHGGDIYDFRHKNSYLSFRSLLIEKLDAVFTVSDDGNKYLRSYTSIQNPNVLTSRLGVRPQVFKETSLSPPFTVVSCSFLVPVKRLHLLIEALTHISLPLRWIHIGDGPLRNQLETLAHQQLDNKANVNWKFAGNLSNANLLNFYSREPVHLFVNCSETEGIPVTMMEAQSFGIPVIGPAVGGIPEIVNETNGRLFSKESSPPEIAKLIEQVLLLSENEYRSLRRNSYESWNERYNADKNFPNFIATIRSLHA
jgi:glycosyltransferase involved in cell wall biosynthesis